MSAHAEPNPLDLGSMPAKHTTLAPCDAIDPYTAAHTEETPTQYVYWSCIMFARRNIDGTLEINPNLNGRHPHNPPRVWPLAEMARSDATLGQTVIEITAMVVAPFPPPPPPHIAEKGA